MRFVLALAAMVLLAACARVPERPSLGGRNAAIDLGTADYPLPVDDESDPWFSPEEAAELYRTGSYSGAYERAKADNTPGTIVELSPRADGTFLLPDDVELNDILIDGPDMIIVRPEGPRFLVIRGGGLFVPTLVIGHVVVPKENLETLLFSREPRPAVGSIVDTPASQRVAPWQGALMSYKYTDYTPAEFAATPEWALRLKCGATLIAREWALTAAHCVTGDLADHPMRVRFGSTNLADTRGKQFPVRETVVHPSYDPKTQVGDIALLRLDPVEMKGVYAARLVDDATLLAAAEAEARASGEVLGMRIFGYGKTSKDALSAILLQDEVKIWTLAECRAAYPGQAARITDKVICANDRGVDTCQGDSGGPLMDPNYDFQFGVVSWGDGCRNVRKPGVYTAIAGYFPWIAETVGKEALANAPFRPEAASPQP